MPLAAPPYLGPSGLLAVCFLSVCLWSACLSLVFCLSSVFLFCLSVWVCLSCLCLCVLSLLSINSPLMPRPMLEISGIVAADTEHYTCHFHSYTFLLPPARHLLFSCFSCLAKHWVLHSRFLLLPSRLYPRGLSLRPSHKHPLVVLQWGPAMLFN